MRYWLSVLVFSIGLGPQAASREVQSATVMYVFPIENQDSNLSGLQILTLTDDLASKLGESGRFKIIPRTELRKRLNHQKHESYKLCHDENCRIEIGRELAAQVIVSAKIGRLGDTCLLSAAVYDLRQAVSSKTASARSPCQEEALISAIEEIARTMTTEQSVQAPSSPAPGKHPPRERTTTPRKVPLPKPVAKSTPERVRHSFPRSYTDLQIVVGMVTDMGEKEIVGNNAMILGFDITYDVCLLEPLFAGAGARLLRSGVIDFHLRFGAILDIGSSLYLQPHIGGGYVYGIEAYQEPDDTWHDFSGAEVHAGLSCRWLVSGGFGLVFDAVLGVAFLQVAGFDDRSTLMKFGASLGVMVGW